MNAYYNQYQSNQVTTASREQILLMLYDGAIRFTRQALEGISSGDRGAKAEGIRKAMAIVMEFRNTLDHKVGGEIAANLDALYDFMIREMIQTNTSNDPQPLSRVEGMLCDLRNTWKQAIDIARNEAQPVPAAVPGAAYQPMKACL